MGKYNPSVNMVEESLMVKLGTFEEVEQFIKDNAHYPLYGWHDNAVELENPCIIKTEAYSREYDKIVD